MRYGSSSRESGAPAGSAGDSVTPGLVHREQPCGWSGGVEIGHSCIPGLAQVYLERAASLPLSPMHREKGVMLIGTSVRHPEVRQHARSQLHESSMHVR